MSSDLPDQRPSGHIMARAMAVYIDCPYRIAREIRACDQRPPTIETIKRFQALHRRSKHRIPEESYKPHEGYHPAEVSDRAELASNAFLKRLREAYPERFAA